MRFDTQALRTRCGTPIFATLSPDKSHTMFMICLSRTRRRDPVMQSEASQSPSHYYAIDAPDSNSEPGDLVLLAPTEQYVKQFLRMTNANTF